jgi:hypothetical protein
MDPTIRYSLTENPIFGVTMALLTCPAGRQFHSAEFHPESEYRTLE